MVSHSVTSEFVVCLFISFLGLACAGTITSVSDESRVLSVKKGILVSLPSRLRSHIEQYNLFEFLCDSGYDLSLGFLAYSRFSYGDWSPCESSWYPYDFDTEIVSCSEISAGPSPKHQNDGALLTSFMAAEVPVMGESMSLFAVKLQMRQFLVTKCLAALEETPAVAPEQVQTTDMPAVIRMVTKIGTSAI